MFLKKINIFVAFEVICVFVKADSEECRQGIFKAIGKVEGLADEEILASHLVSSWYECVSFCLEEGKNCTWFLYSELVGRRDNCYLHGKDSEDSERDFDLLTYAGSKEENWQVYKLVKIALEPSLKEQFCQNSVRTVVDSCEPQGYKCECDDLHYGKRCDRGKDDFDLAFPAQQENESYLFIHNAIKSNLTEFTFAAWFKTNVGLKEYRLFTYIVKDIPSIEIWFKTGLENGSPLVHSFIIFRIDNRFEGAAFQPVNDNVWHHVAITWSRNGNLNIFIDGKLFAIKEIDHFEIPKGGDVYIGKYPGLNVVQNASGFIGSLSRLHLWNRVLPGEEIEEMAIRPNNYVGNVIDWYKLAAYVAGDVEVMKPSSALHTDKDLNFLINYPDNSWAQSGYISCPVLKVNDILSACLWMKTSLHGVYISQEAENGNKIYFAFGSSENNEMFVIIHNKEVKSNFSNTKIVNNEWHFYCISWNGRSGEVQFFFDGDIFGKRITHDDLKASLPATENISVLLKRPTHVDQELKYIGKISYLNLWSVELSERTVKAMTAGGLNINGDVISWRDVPNCIVGKLFIVKNTPVYFPGFTASRKRSEWCEQQKPNSPFSPLYARFGGNRLGTSMRWRCYCACALNKAKFRYDNEQQSRSYYTLMHTLYHIL